MRYYILILEESLKNYSIIGVGENCRVGCSYKNNISPFDTLQAGDKIIGYIGGSKKTFSYLFTLVDKSADNTTCQLVKDLEIAFGLSIEKANADIQKIVYDYENTKPFNEITEKQYQELVSQIYSNIADQLPHESPADTSQSKAIDLSKAKQPRSCTHKHPFNQILYGAPGTGKTYSTVEYALSIIQDRDVDELKKNTPRTDAIKEYTKYVAAKQIVFTTFHQSYSYEDFIQGLRPEPSKDSLIFLNKDGVFKDIAQRAFYDDSNRYVIILDEINRAQISKVFGELITLIESDKRWGEDNAMSVTLPSGEPFTVPNNLYIIGTMNSADKSISLVDTALRRRFTFIEMEPKEDYISDGQLRTVFKALNKALYNELESTDLLIGHSFFIGKSIRDLPLIMNNHIIPLLYEYLNDHRKKILGILSEVLSETNVEIVPDPHDYIVHRIRVKEKSSPDVQTV